MNSDIILEIEMAGIHGKGKLADWIFAIHSVLSSKDQLVVLQEVTRLYEKRFMSFAAEGKESK